MKTRQKNNGLPIVQTTVQGISDESPSTPLSSRESSRKRRKAIQGSTNCAHGDERACNVQAKRLSRA